MILSQLGSNVMTHACVCLCMPAYGLTRACAFAVRDFWTRFLQEGERAVGKGWSRSQRPVCKDIEYQTFSQEEARAGHDIRASAPAGADAPDWRGLCARAAAAAAAQGEAGGGAHAAACQAPATRSGGVHCCCAQTGYLPSTPLQSHSRVQDRLVDML